MPIVSISLNQDILSEIDNLKKSLGFSGRSEAIRAGIRNFVSEEKQKTELSGKVHAILLVVHSDKFDHIVSGIKHNFEDLITTHLHSKIEGDKCMELFVINGAQPGGRRYTQRTWPRQATRSTHYRRGENPWATPVDGIDLCSGVLPQAGVSDRTQGYAPRKGVECVREMLQVQQLRRDCGIT